MPQWRGSSLSIHLRLRQQITPHRPGGCPVWGDEIPDRLRDAAHRETDPGGQRSALQASHKHPTSESFSSDSAFATEVLTAPRLRTVDLKHAAADAKFVALLADHPTLETLRLWPKGGRS